ncbi:MAG: GDP-mannose 4,6-dehydratase [Anaerolinea sp.]|nr:GDP-mannose 4,6-dehydratase [Anaerolinea sp.]
MGKRALICGISGQDGAYLARFLLEKGYEVYGTSRDAQMSGFRNLERLGIRRDVQLESMALNDFRSMLQVLTKTRPDEVYNLAGQSSVALSFEQPVEALESITVGTLNLLESIRFADQPIRFYNAGSSECFGDTGGVPADESTPFHPRSPYAVAKAAAHWEAANYREAYGIHACSGILFNHESPLRPERFVTQKVVSAACRIVAGSRERLQLGNLAIQRDWGWAPEYVEAIWLILQQPTADDYVIATGQTHSLEAFVEEAFRLHGLDWREHVDISSEFLRPTDILVGCANPARARERLGWAAKSDMHDVVCMMVDAKINEFPIPGVS